MALDIISYQNHRDTSNMVGQDLRWITSQCTLKIRPDTARMMLVDRDWAQTTMLLQHTTETR